MHEVAITWGNFKSESNGNLFRSSNLEGVRGVTWYITRRIFSPQCKPLKMK